MLDEPDENAGGMCHKYYPQWEEGSDPPIPNDAFSLGGLQITFQHGPIKEVGRNGLTNEALLAIVIDRLECAQAGHSLVRRTPTPSPMPALALST